MADREQVRKLARESIARGDATGWFEELYRRAGGEWREIPWADLVPNPYLVEWLERSSSKVDGRSCLIVGCGLGDDAEVAAEAGYAVSAFDVSPTAVDGCQARFPNSRVAYTVADVLSPPAGWAGGFDLVVESYTLQVLPPETRIAAMKQLAQLVAAGGQLLILCRARDRGDPTGELPWPITREELTTFGDCGLREISCEDFLDHEVPPVRRFRVLYERTA